MVLRLQKPSSLCRAEETFSKQQEFAVFLLGPATKLSAYIGGGLFQAW